MQKMGKFKCIIIAIAFGVFAWEFWCAPKCSDTVIDNSYPDLGFLTTISKANAQLALGLLHPINKRIHSNHTLGVGKKGKAWTLKSTDSSDARLMTYSLLEDLSENGRLEVRLSKDPVDGVTCYSVAWVSLSEHFKPMDCFALGESHWYGGAEVFEQRWPMDEQQSIMQPFLSGDYLSPRWRKGLKYGRYGSILEPYWISSSGLGIHVSENVDLYSSFNENGNRLLCLKTGNRFHGDELHDSHNNWLNYTVCQAENVFQVHKYMSERFLPKPRSIPDERMMRYPIWSTWARYKVRVKQSSVIEYANEIKKYSFPNSQIEIDDMYTTRYGDFDFDPVKFPNATQMISQLHSLGFRVTCWMTPIANIDSQAFLEGAKNYYWMLTNPPHSVPSLTRWWQGMAGVLDVTNEEAVKWYVKRLKKFQSDHLGIDSFKFDAGEFDFLPRDIAIPSSMVNRNQLTNLYVRLTEEFGGMVEVRSGFRSQDLPVFFRMLDKDSEWGYENGLRSMIPNALLMGIIGYPFILPDMIGGNCYGNYSNPLRESSLPDRELFIRWLQLSAFLPSMQFSIVPWQYDEEVVKIALDYVHLHEVFVTPEILKAAKNSIKTGEPIIRPLWWIDQTEESLTIDNQFLIGDSLLVAPILEKGHRKRDIYLPGRNEKWRNHATQETSDGGQWLKSVKVSLDQVPVFVRIKPK